MRISTLVRFLNDIQRLQGDVQVKLVIGEPSSGRERFAVREIEDLLVVDDEFSPGGKALFLVDEAAIEDNVKDVF